MASIDQILKQNFGLTGKAESFTRKKPVKKYNAERYLAAYTALKADEQKQIAEAAMLRVEVMTMKARGEADETIMTKVKNAGKDLWRGVKNLLGKLVILITELFAKLMTKAGKAKKLIDKLKTLMSEVNANREKLASKEVSLPIGGNVNSYASMGNLSEDDIKNATASEPTGIKQSFLASVERFKIFCQAFNTKGDYAQTAKELASRLDKFKSAGVYADKKFDEKNVNDDILEDLGKSNGLDTQVGKWGLSSIFASAIILNKNKKDLEAKREAYSNRKDAEKNSWKDTKVSGADNLIKIIKSSIDTLTDVYRRVEQSNKDSATIRNHINKVKNAPTSVTKEFTPEVVQFVRKYCSQATTYLNLQRKIQETDLALFIYNISNIYTGINSAVKEAKKGK